MKNSLMLLVAFRLIFRVFFPFLANTTVFSSCYFLFSLSGEGRRGVQCSDTQFRIVFCVQHGFLLAGSVSSL